MSIILQADGISKTYQAGSVKVEALKTESVSFNKGEFAAIVGKSGSGKSTLLRVLASIDRPDTGKVLIDGEDIFSMKDKELSAFRRRKIGFIYQDYSLFPEFTAYENIIMPMAFDNKKADEKEIDDILEKLGISHCKNKFPDQMSGGEQQRVSIARALSTHPAVIFADEPTGNLDAESAQVVADMLSMASRNFDQTIIMVTHDPQMAEIADRILTISDGRICEE
ncbi:MAG: ABC transporter ATP-binding protein [Lachnospira sp.]